MFALCRVKFFSKITDAFVVGAGNKSFLALCKWTLFFFSKLLCNTIV